MVQIKYPPIIDISHWIDVPNFQRLDPVPWLIITKATQGTDLLDATYAERADLIREAGIRLGAFHFMVPGDEIAQADWFCEILLTVGLHGNEILACDMEVAGVSLAQIKNFLDRIQMKTGLRPLIYSTQLILEGLYPNGICPAWLKGEWLWIAEYPADPDLTNEIPSWIVPRECSIQRIALWQYTDDGILGGIPGNNVDLDLIHPIFLQAIGLQEPQGGTMSDYLYSITPAFGDGSAIRPEHDTGNTKLPIGLPYGKIAYGNVRWVALADIWKMVNGVNTRVNLKDDVWLEVVEVNSMLLDPPGWIAEIHMGKRYATITQIGTAEPPPASGLPELPVTIALGDDVSYEKQTVNIILHPKK